MADNSKEIEALMKAFAEWASVPTSRADALESHMKERLSLSDAEG